MSTDIPQTAVDAAFPALHGGHDFRDAPSLRAALEAPVREALAVAGLAEAIAERDALRTALLTLLNETFYRRYTYRDHRANGTDGWVAHISDAEMERLTKVAGGEGDE